MSRRPAQQPLQPVVVGNPTVTWPWRRSPAIPSTSLESCGYEPGTPHPSSHARRLDHSLPTDTYLGMGASQQRIRQDGKFRVSALQSRVRAARLGRPSVLSSAVRKRRQASQQVETVDLLGDSEPEEDNAYAAPEPARGSSSGVTQALSPAQRKKPRPHDADESELAPLAASLKKPRRRDADESELPPPSASLSLRARQLRMLLCGGVCQDLQTTYPKLLASFRGKAIQTLNIEDARAPEQGIEAVEEVARDEAVEEVARDEAAAAVAVKRARKGLEHASHRAVVASARLRRLKHSEASAAQAIARCDADLLAVEKKLASVVARKNQLQESKVQQLQHFREEYQAEIQAEIMSIQQQLDQNTNSQSSMPGESACATENSNAVILPSCLAGWCGGGASSCSLQSPSKQADETLETSMHSSIAEESNGAASCISETHAVIASEESRQNQEGGDP